MRALADALHSDELESVLAKVGTMNETALASARADALVAGDTLLLLVVETALRSKAAASARGRLASTFPGRPPRP